MNSIYRKILGQKECVEGVTDFYQEWNSNLLPRELSNNPFIRGLTELKSPLIMNIENEV